MDFTRNEDVLAKLIGQPEKWRSRTIERIELSSELWTERERTTHVIPLRRPRDHD